MPKPPPNAARQLQYMKAVRDSSLSRNAKFLCLTVATYADNQTGHCYPSRETLVKATGYSLNVVKRALAEATDTGWLYRKPGRFNGPADTWITIPGAPADGPESGPL
ncbi:helix-turn-helix domain-containing protein [Glutamicibacter sp. MNS18]|uniref:helix-turn-helix domain-containing protein n=1 Tax=Glutamicibacter sp. MNS18 TaxID=2989817 RepID=UPI0035323EF4